MMRFVAPGIVVGLLFAACGCGATPPTPASPAPAPKPEIAKPANRWVGEGTPPLHQVCPRGGPVVAACFSPDGKQILTGDYLCNVALWSPDSDKPLWLTNAVDEEDPTTRPQYEFWKRGAFAVAFAADGKRVFLAWGAGVAQLDRETGTVLKISRFPNGALAYCREAFGPRTTLAFVPGADECVFSGNRGLILFDFATDKWNEKFSVPLRENAGLYVVVSPKGDRVLAWDGDKQISECDLQTSQVSRFPRVYFGRQPWMMGYALDGDRIWGWGEGLGIYDRQTGTNSKVTMQLEVYRGQVWLSPDAKHLIGLPSGEWWPDRRCADQIDVIRTQDGERLRFFSSDGIFWTPRRRSQPDEPHLERTEGLVVFTPDSKTVALTGGGPRGAKIGFWDVNTGKHIGTSKQER